MPSDAQWVAVSERLPEDETPVLIVHKGKLRIGEIRWEYPGCEDNYEAFRYWDSPDDDGQEWEWNNVTHWMPLPKLPAIDALQAEVSESVKAAYKRAAARCAEVGAAFAAATGGVNYGHAQGCSDCEDAISAMGESDDN